MRIILLLASLILAVTLNAQIEIQTNFEPKISAPLDNRGAINTLADTSTIEFTGAGVFTWVIDEEKIYIHNGVQWKELKTGSAGGDLHLTISQDTSTQNLAIFNFEVQSWDNIYALPENAAIARDTTLLPTYKNDAQCPCDSDEYYRLSQDNDYGWPLGTLRRKQ